MFIHIFICMFFIGGGISVKIFRRTAILDEANAYNPKLQTLKSIQVPKKSKLFVEQSLRERENFLLIHQVLISIIVNN